MTKQTSTITTLEEARALLEQLRQAGILQGELGVYRLDEEATDDTDTEAATASEALSEPELATDTEPESAAQPEPEPHWVNYEPDAPAALNISKALLKAAALVGGGYIAYRMARRPHLRPVRF